MIDDGLRKSVKSLAGEELQRANYIWPQFNSPHEGYGVLKEECEEASDELRKMNCSLGDVWYNVKTNVRSIEELELIENTAIELALEAIQVSAMAHKFINMYTEQYQYKTEKEKAKDIDIDRRRQGI